VTDMLFYAHQGIGYLAFVAVVVAAVMAFNRAKNGQEFSDGTAKAAVILLDIQVLLGIVFYVIGEQWDREEMVAIVHPLLNVAAVGIAHVGLKRARSEQMAADAHRKVGRAFAVTMLLLLAGIGIVATR
jgi:heme A synthase